MTRSLGHRLGPWIALGWILLCGPVAWAHDTGAVPGKTDAAPARTAPYDPDQAKAASRISDPEAATRAYLEAVSPERRAQTKSYAAGQYVLHAVDFVVNSAVMILLIAPNTGPNTGIEGIADVAGLPLLWFLLSLVLFVATPAINTLSRWEEAQADDFGLAASRQPDAAATTFLKLGEYRDLDPDPVIEAIFFDHPSGRSRIRNAMNWKRAHAPAAR